MINLLPLVGFATAFTVCFFIIFQPFNLANDGVRIQISYSLSDDIVCTEKLGHASHSWLKDCIRSRPITGMLCVGDGN